MAWFEKDQRRFLYEFEAVKAYNRTRHSEHHIALSRSPEGVYLRAAIRPGANLYQARVSLEGKYPQLPPIVVIEEPALPPGTPHLIGPQSPCLWKSTGTQPCN